MALTSSSHASSSYHVFLSFRGEDTRHSFTGYLYNALTKMGIPTFIDDEKLESGEEITPALEKSIKESRIAIIVLSKDYASSSFCLDELATIIDCKSKGMLVIPVFYKVDPSDVRHQKGSYGEALAKHESRFQQEKLQKWKTALTQAADLSGYHFKEGDVYEYKFTERIVDRVLGEINHTARLSVPDDLVGLESPKAEIMELLDVGSDDGVHVVGIHGMGGIGKSTLARVVYNHLLAKKKFDGSCYLENVREESNRHGGLNHLQSILLQKILGDKNMNVTSVQEGAPMIEDRLQGKKVLLLLDDVDNTEQFEAIVPSLKWFGPGSRIIITSRDKHLLACLKVQKTYEEVLNHVLAYEVKELNKNDARQLLTRKAFENGKVDPTYEEVLNHVLAYASGLPLALKVIGSHLVGKSVEDWESAINQYKESPDNKIQNILKVSFDAWTKTEKSVFLDIVCCFKGYEKAEVEDVLHALYGYSMKYQIGVLEDKSLIKIITNLDKRFILKEQIDVHDLIQDVGRQVDVHDVLDLLRVFEDKSLIKISKNLDKKFILKEQIDVHDLIQDVGRQIEQEQPPKKPGKRRRLWLPEQIFEVLEDNTGTREIEIIYLDVPEADQGKTIEWDGNAFKKMKKLKILIIKNGQFSVVPNYLPNSLRVLEWWGYPSHCLPSDFHPENLAICKLPDSRLRSLELGGSSKKFMNLTVLNFDGCKDLTRICDLSSCPNLEKLSFQRCHNLVEVHKSIGSLDRLLKLNAFGCSQLKSFPPIHLTSLREIIFSFCRSLESFPEVLGKMENIISLELSTNGITKLPMSFQYLIGLEHLSLSGCIIDLQVLRSIAMMPRLTKITAVGCKWGQCQWLEQEEDEGNVGSKVSSKLTTLCVSLSDLNDDFFQKIGFKRFDHMEILDLSDNNFTILPECIKEFKSLRYLDVSNCEHLEEIEGVPPNLEEFKAIECKSLSSLSRSMFIKQELYEARMRKCIFAGACVPEWFDKKSRGPSTSFWFRNNFPRNVLCLLIAAVDPNWMEHDIIAPIVVINGKVHEPRDEQDNEPVTKKMDHTYICDLLYDDGMYDSFEVSLEKEWNHVEVTYADVMDTSNIKATGIHLFKQESNNEDIRFTDPHSKKRKSDCDLNSSESQIQPL